ncbi:MAG: LytTR family transcriptional regulator DNA-binding domain-containing protein [Bacilli bacterium]|nr:LytTR family transcriptional regulator DNA-binding domain-containing protein [Bacilli bacterium]
MKVEVVIDHEQNEKKVIIKTNVHDATVDKILAALNNIDSSIIGKIDNENFVLKLEDVYYFEAVENKVYAYLEEEVYEVTYKIAELNDLLKHSSFIQTARTVILNLDKIQKIKSMVNGRILAVLNNDEKMIITRVYASGFKNKIKGGK